MYCCERVRRPIHSLSTNPIGHCPRSWSAMDASWEGISDHCRDLYVQKWTGHQQMVANTGYMVVCQWCRLAAALTMGSRYVPRVRWGADSVARAELIVVV